jgi:hypothetical protein
LAAKDKTKFVFGMILKGERVERFGSGDIKQDVQRNFILKSTL